MGESPHPPEPHDGTPDDIPVVEDLAALVGDRDRSQDVVDQLRAALVQPVDEGVAERHLEAIFAAADEHTKGVIDLRSRSRRRGVVGGAIAIATLTVTSGLAAAGTLPSPIQDAVSSVASVFSIDLPSSSDSDGGIDGVDVPGDDAPGRTGATPGATAPGQTGDTPSGPEDTPGATAPGQTGEPPGGSGSNPGNSGDTPGATAPGADASEDPPAADPQPGGRKPEDPGSQGQGSNSDRGGN